MGLKVRYKGIVSKGDEHTSIQYTVLGFFLGILGSLFVALFIKVIDFKVTDNPNMFYGMFLFLSIVALITVICFYYKLKH